MAKSREGLSKVQGNVTIKQQEAEKLKSGVRDAQDPVAVSSVQSQVYLAYFSNFSRPYARWRHWRMKRLRMRQRFILCCQWYEISMRGHARIVSRVLLSLVLPHVDSVIEIFGVLQAERDLYVLVRAT